MTADATSRAIVSGRGCGRKGSSPADSRTVRPAGHPLCINLWTGGGQATGAGDKSGITPRRPVDSRGVDCRGVDGRRRGSPRRGPSISYMEGPGPHAASPGTGEPGPILGAGRRRRRHRHARDAGACHGLLAIACRRAPSGPERAARRAPGPDAEPASHGLPGAGQPAVCGSAVLGRRGPPERRADRRHAGRLPGPAGVERSPAADARRGARAGPDRRLAGRGAPGQPHRGGRPNGR